MNSYLEAFLRLMYPATCGVCKIMLNLDEKGICHNCQVQLSGLRFTPDEAILHERFRSLDGGWALYPYESPVKDILMAIKFSRKRWLVHVFQEEIRLVITALAAENHYDHLIPIPLDRHKWIEREFNQSELIARLMAPWAGSSVKNNTLSKRRRTMTQSQLSRDQRRANLIRAFRVQQRKNVEGKNLLLVDDIFTTGATAEEAAKTLKNHGAKRVDIFALARTQDDR